MIALISPAMNMEETPPIPAALTTPVFQKQADELARLMAGYAHWELEGLLKVNPQIALRAFGLYQSFGQGPLSPALLSFRGLAYRNMGAEDFSPAELDWAQEHLLILSALYGALRPLDGIRPYRLDFMGRVRVDGQGLYTWWGRRVCQRAAETGQVLVNLASGEYERLILPHVGPLDRVVTCRFITPVGRKLVCKATDSKMARGQMARFLIKNRIDRPEGLRDFSWGGYTWSPHRSNENLLCFIGGGGHEAF